ncbi:MAG: hypothetical protein AAB521_03640 [Patescibacteria group bacterium]
MALTKLDLTQIGSVIEDKLGSVKKDLTGLKEDLTDVKKDLTDVKKRVKKIEKTVDVAIRIFNSDDIKIEKRVSKIEVHLGLPT